MGFTKALYYPTIDILNEDWLKTAVLFWDEINTIVPLSIKNPYKENTTQFLADEGILKPMTISPDFAIVKELAEDTINYLNTNEGFQLLTQGRSKSVTLHRDKLPKDVSRLFDIHPEKLPYEIQFHLRDSLTKDGWFRVDSSFAVFYMTLLANKICEYKSIALLTDNPLTSNLTDKVRLDNQIAIKERGYNSRNDRYINLAQGLLTNFIIEGVRIKKTSSLEDVLNFKRKHRDELGLFRTNIANLTKNVSKDKPFETIRREVEDIYNDEFLPAYNSLKKALNGGGIKWASDNFMKISFISTSATALPILLGLTLPQALVAGSGVSLITSLISYNQEKREKLRTNPYSYLLSVSKKI
ncbi:MAG TPA: hypothetical protein DGG95_06130 [Cytophagales bacterium]|jgi:hypothetical protein|nr:hypothetical protein [Cytophagales bacterium]